MCDVILADRMEGESARELEVLFIVKIGSPLGASHLHVFLRFVATSWDEVGN